MAFVNITWVLDYREIYNQAFSKYETASKLNPKDYSIFYNWGTTLFHLAKVKNDDEDLHNQAFEKLSKAVEWGGNVYNLACLHSIRKNKKEALQISLCVCPLLLLSMTRMRSDTLRDVRSDAVNTM